MKIYLFLVAFFYTSITFAQQENNRTLYFPKIEAKPASVPAKKKVWVFVMAGQSNMAGRGQVEPEDTVANERILAINKAGELVLAKEPLNLNEPSMVGLDCGISFARTLLKFCPPDVSVLMLHTAVGGSSIQKWINDSVHRDVPLLSNFKARVERAKSFGEIKGILWHQGEADANAKGIPLYAERLDSLFGMFRQICGDKKLPILLGELGYFSKTSHEPFMEINRIMHEHAQHDKSSAVIVTKGLDHKGDQLHFNAEGQRSIGRMFAELYVSKWF
jgi:hypothetical protein